MVITQSVNNKAIWRTESNTYVAFMQQVFKCNTSKNNIENQNVYYIAFGIHVWKVNVAEGKKPELFLHFIRYQHTTLSLTEDVPRMQSKLRHTATDSDFFLQNKVVSEVIVTK